MTAPSPAPAAPGLLIVWMNIEPGHEADFDGWYTREHVPERVGVPGFRIGARYEAISGEPRFLGVYDTDSAQVLSGAAYLERLNHPTPWTQRVMPAFQDTVRAIGSLIGEQGRGLGGMLRTVRIEPAAGRRDALREALGGSTGAALLRELYGQPGIARVRAMEAVERPSSADTAETAMRGRDRSATFVLLVDGNDAAAIQQACDRVLPPARLAGLGAAGPGETGDYRLLYTLCAPR
jgi:hypothetical protein